MPDVTFIELVGFLMQLLGAGILSVFGIIACIGLLLYLMVLVARGYDKLYWRNRTSNLQKKGRKHV